MTVPLLHYTVHSLSTQFIVLLIAVLLLSLVAIIRVLRVRRPDYPDVPFATISGLSPIDSWVQDAIQTTHTAVSSLSPDQNFQVVTPAGPVLVLRNTYANEAAQSPGLSLSAHLRENYFPDYPGFEGVRVGLEGEIHDAVRETVTRRLTQALGNMTPDIIEESAYAIRTVFGDSEEGKAVHLESQIREVVARVTSRVLVGQRLCRDHDWLSISRQYHLCSGTACASLAAVPRILRPLLHWFLPACRRLRCLVRGATELIQMEVRTRRTENRKATCDLDKTSMSHDAITWLYEESSKRGRRLDTKDLVALQLGLTVAAYHTTTLELLHAICKLREHPNLIRNLRDEIARTVGKSGWSKTSFAQLHLMDSFLLESRRHYSGPLKLFRLATSNVVLSNGFVIKKGTRVQVLDRDFDSPVVPDHDAFDAFLATCSTSPPSLHLHGKWQFVTTSPLQMGFGLGPHACPGRFFAAHEMKAILAHLLMKYDLDLDSTYGEPKKRRIDGHLVPDHTARLVFRRRREEVDLDAVHL